MKLIIAWYLFILSMGLTYPASSGRSADQALRLAEPPKKTVPTGNPFDRLPPVFERNEGQTDARVQYLVRGSGYALFLTSTEAVFSAKNSVIRMKPLGASLAADKIEGIGPLPGKSNYYLGSDATKWRTGVSQFAGVKYRQVYPGIDLVFHGSPQSELEFDFIVASEARYEDIALHFDGAQSVEIDREGNLNLITASGALTQKKPLLYQDIQGERRVVEGGYRKTPAGDIAFRVGEYDHTQPLTIDPVLRLSSSTYVGGAEIEYVFGMSVDSAGKVYITGQTESADFPDPLQDFAAGKGKTGYSGTGDCYVAQLNSNGTALVYSTFLGGERWDICNSIAADKNGNAYVIGDTTSDHFPTQNAYHAKRSGKGPGDYSDVFTAKLDSKGAIVYSTFLGALGSGTAIAMDSNDSAYLTGNAFSFELPAAASYQREMGDYWDTFVAKLAPSGKNLVYATYLGGNGRDDSNSIAVDAQFNAYVTGRTFSTNFPVKNAYQPYLRGNGTLAGDAFITKLNPAGDSIEYSTYLGGVADDYSNAITVDGTGSAYVVGITQSSNFPVTLNAYQFAFGGGFSDAFIAKLSPNGNTLLYSSFLGGAALDDGRAVTVGKRGEIYVTGETMSSQDAIPKFPLKNELEGQSNLMASYAAFVAKIDPSKAGSDQLAYSTYLGGNGNSFAFGLAASDREKCVYVGGHTAATNFPTKSPYQAAYAGGFYDGSVAKICEGGRIYLR